MYIDITVVIVLRVDPMSSVYMQLISWAECNCLRHALSITKPISLQKLSESFHKIDRLLNAKYFRHRKGWREEHKESLKEQKERWRKKYTKRSWVPLCSYNKPWRPGAINWSNVCSQVQIQLALERIWWFLCSKCEKRKQKKREGTNNSWLLQIL